MIWALLIVGLIGLDQLAKNLASANLQTITSIPLIPDYFELAYVENRGVAFGMMQGAKAFFIPITIIITLVIAYYLFYKLPKKGIMMHLSLSMILAGAIGNLFDRIRLGYVVDFFYFHIKDVFHWPVFNVADSVVVVGTILLAWQIIFEEARQSDAT